jgi:aspartate beta-hydroxylase
LRAPEYGSRQSEIIFNETKIMATPQEIAQLSAQAGQAANIGRWEEAEQIWQRVLHLDAHHPQALYSLSMHAFQRRDFQNALKLITAAREAAPNDPLLALNEAIIRRDSGDIQGEWDALQQALAIDAYYLPAILAKATILEREGQLKAAAKVYQNALKIAPPQDHWPAGLRDQLRHGQQLARHFEEALELHLLEAVKEQALPNVWQEAVSIMAGRTKPYHSDCNQLQVPRLPAIPFYDPYQFGWAHELEAKTPEILAELQAMLANPAANFAPYIAYRPGDPVNQWGDLNHSKKWSSLSLWRGGVRDEVNLAACPQTAAALDQIEMAEIGGLCPNAMFSALAPHTQIPPHTGETNARLVVHLPLIVPPNCHYRVGYEERQWEVGKLLIFDDTLEHTARNDSDELRVVLIFDIWNPHLSTEERILVQSLTDAARAFGRD